MKKAYFLLTTLVALCAAEHNHYKHLDIEYVKKEATRLAYLSKDYILKVIEDNNVAIRRILKNRDHMIVAINDQEKSAEKWKEEFEEKYADDFDKTLIASNVCKEKFGDIHECHAYVPWDHPFDTRDETLRKEFLREVEFAIR